MKTKPKPWTKEHELYCLHKQKELLTFLKDEAHRKDIDDDIWDIALFDREVARFIKVQGKKVEECLYVKNTDYNLKVKTWMFWWQAKHINRKEYESFTF